MLKRFTVHPFLLLLLPLALVACQPAPVRPDPPPPIATTYHRDTTSAVDFLAKTLAQQLARVPRPTSSVVPVEEFFSTQSAEVSTSGRALQQQLAQTLTRTFAPMEFVPLDTASANKAQWVLLANYATPSPTENLQPGKWVRLQVAMVESSSGKVLTRINTYLDASQFNAEPTPFFKDAPMYFTDERHRQRVNVMDGQAQSLTGNLQIQSLLSSQRPNPVCDAVLAYAVLRAASHSVSDFQCFKALSPDSTGHTNKSCCYFSQTRTLNSTRRSIASVASLAPVPTMVS